MVVDPGSETNHGKKSKGAAAYQDKENTESATKRDTSLTAYMPPATDKIKTSTIAAKPSTGNKKRRISEMTKPSPNDSQNEASQSTKTSSKGVKTRKLSDFFQKKQDNK